MMAHRVELNNFHPVRLSTIALICDQISEGCNGGPSERIIERNSVRVPERLYETIPENFWKMS